MPKVVDLTGKRFNSLVVLRQAGTLRGNTTWDCRCDCGNEATVRAHMLKSERTQSCGCIKPEAARATLYRSRRDSYGGFNRDDVG